MPQHLLALALIAIPFAVPAAGFAQQPADARLQATLDKLNASSKTFHSAQADFKKDLYNHFIRDTETQNGQVYFERQRDATQLGILLFGPTGKPERIAEYKNGTIRDYNPALKCYDSVHASPGKIETFLTLGFGGSGDDLKKAWQIADLGPETIAGVKTEKLDLVPIDPGAKANVKHVTLWIDLDNDVSLQQIFYLTTGDTQTAHYSKPKLNEKLNTKPFEFGGKPCGK
jgi:outer membrane lipoprotein-sorting protein